MATRMHANSANMQYLIILYNRDIHYLDISIIFLGGGAGGVLYADIE